MKTLRRGVGFPVGRADSELQNAVGPRKKTLPALVCSGLGKASTSDGKMGSILAEGAITSVESVILKRPPCWTGHCMRMPDSQLPKRVLCSQLIVS